MKGLLVIATTKTFKLKIYLFTSYSSIQINQTVKQFWKWLFVLLFHVLNFYYQIWNIIDTSNEPYNHFSNTFNNFNIEFLVTPNPTKWDQQIHYHPHSPFWRHWRQNLCSPHVLELKYVESQSCGPRPPKSINTYCKLSLQWV